MALPTKYVNPNIPCPIKDNIARRQVDVLAEQHYNNNWLIAQSFKITIKAVISLNGTYGIALRWQQIGHL